MKIRVNPRITTFRRYEYEYYLALSGQTRRCHQCFEGLRQYAVHHRPHRCIIAAIDEIDVLKERYRQAVEYMDWFKPAWMALSEDERYVLQTFYWNEDERQTDAVYDICDHFNIERSSAYNKKNRALQHLALLLYGK